MASSADTGHLLKSNPCATPRSGPSRRKVDVSAASRPARPYQIAEPFRIYKLGRTLSNQRRYAPPVLGTVLERRRARRRRCTNGSDAACSPPRSSAVSAVPSAAQAAMNAKEKANLQFVLDWWREVIQSRHVELAPKYQAEDYIQHNINIQTGRDGFVKFFGSLGPRCRFARSWRSRRPSRSPRATTSCVIWEREGKDPADPSKTYKYNTYDLLRLRERQGAGALGLGAQEAEDSLRRRARRRRLRHGDLRPVGAGEEEPRDRHRRVQGHPAVRSRRTGREGDGARPTSSTIPTCRPGARRSSSSSAAPASRSRSRPSGKTSRADDRQRLLRVHDVQAREQGSGRSREDLSRVLVRHGAGGRRPDSGTLGRGGEEPAAPPR